MKTNADERKKTCPRCHTIFSCYTQNCWCNELPQIMPLSANEDCLCPQCLRVAIDVKLKATT